MSGRPGSGPAQAAGGAHAADITAEAQELLGCLRRAGYRLTAARRAVAEALGRGEHKSAPEVVADVRRRHPRVGRASVYRTLTLLSRLGALQPSLLATAQAHYAPASHGHHHHFVCTACRHVIELEECAMVELIEAVQRRWGVRVEGHLVELRGRCRRCRGQAGPRGSIRTAGPSGGARRG